MGALGNLDHERFCQEAHKRLWSGEKRSTAIAAAYRATMYSGENPDDSALAPNARRLTNRKDVAARLKELADYAGKLAGIDASWGMLQLKKIVDEVDAYTLDHYMARDDDGKRRNEFDLTGVTGEQMARLTEITTEITIQKDEDGGETIRRKIKLRGPDRFSVVPDVVAKMARIGGWEAPKKIAATTPEGKQVTWEDLVGQSYKPETEGAA